MHSMVSDVAERVRGRGGKAPLLNLSIFPTSDEDLACILEAVLLLLDSSLRSETRMVSLLSGMEELRIAVARLLELAAWTVQNANLPERIATSYASKAEEALAAYRILQESTETVLNGLNQHQRGERPAVDNVLTSPKTNDAFASSGGAVDARTSKCLRPDRDPNVGTTPDKSVVLHRTESAILMPPPTTPRPSHSASASASASAPPASSSAAAHDLTQLSFGGTSMDETPPSERADADMIEKVMMRLRAGLPLRLGLKCVETQIESQSQSAIQMQVQLHQVHAQRQRQRQTNDINQSVRDRSSSPVVHDGYDSVLDRSLPGARADSPTPTSISISISHRSLSPIGDMHSFPSGSDSLSTSTAPSARVDSQNVRDRIKRIRSERPRMLALSCVETQPGPEEEIEREEDSRQRGLGPRRAGRQEELPERLQQRQQQQSRQRQQRHYHRRGPSPASEGVRGHKRVRSRSPSPSASL